MPRVGLFHRVFIRQRLGQGWVVARRWPIGFGWHKTPTKVFVVHINWGAAETGVGTHVDQEALLVECPLALVNEFGQHGEIAEPHDRPIKLTKLSVDIAPNHDAVVTGADLLRMILRVYVLP